VTFHEINSDAAKRAIAFMGQQFQYKGGTYYGIINELSDDAKLMIGGVRNTFNASVYVRKNLFPIPVIGDRIIVSGVERYIASIQSDPISWTLTLEDISQ